MLPWIQKEPTHVHWVKSVRIRSFFGPYSVWMRNNLDQRNPEYGHFSCNGCIDERHRYKTSVTELFCENDYNGCQLFLQKASITHARLSWIDLWFYCCLTIAFSFQNMRLSTSINLPLPNWLSQLEEIVYTSIYVFSTLLKFLKICI